MTTNLAPVLAISIANQPWFDEMYGPLVAGIKSKTEFKQVEDAASALRLLSQSPAPSAVLITDQALTEPGNAAVWDAVLDFVRSGGTAVVMGFFPSFVLPDNIKPFFAQAASAAGIDTSGLPQSYSQKAVFVSNVAPRDMLYMMDEDSVVNPLVFSATNAHTPGETAVAMTKIGNGKLGYVGDVNAEGGSRAVVLAMCGLL